MHGGVFGLWGSQWLHVCMLCKEDMFSLKMHRAYGEIEKSVHVCKVSGGRRPDFKVGQEMPVQMEQ